MRAILENLTLQAEPSNHLFEELKNYLAEYQMISPVQVELSLPASWSRGLTPVQQRQIMHIVREALVNVHRHAQATSAKIDVQETSAELRIIIEDNGIGFEPLQVETGKHLGLEIMRSRAERIGGKVVVKAIPGQGTRIMAVFPYEY